MVTMEMSNHKTQLTTSSTAPMATKLLMANVTKRKHHDNPTRTVTKKSLCNTATSWIFPVLRQSILLFLLVKTWGQVYLKVLK